MTSEHFLSRLTDYQRKDTHSIRTKSFIICVFTLGISACAPTPGPTDEVKRLADSLAHAELVDPMVSALELKASQTDNWPGLSLRTKKYQLDDKQGVYTTWILGDSVVKVLDEAKYTQGSYKRYYYLSGAELFLAGYSEFKDSCADGKPCEWEHKYYFEKGRIFKAMARSSSYPDGERTGLQHLNFDISLEDYEEAFKNQHTQSDFILNYMRQ